MTSPQCQFNQEESLFRVPRDFLRAPFLFVLSSCVKNRRKGKFHQSGRKRKKSKSVYAEVPLMFPDPENDLRLGSRQKNKTRKKIPLIQSCSRLMDSVAARMNVHFSLSVPHLIRQNVSECERQDRIARGYLNPGSRGQWLVLSLPYHFSMMPKHPFCP